MADYLIQDTTLTEIADAVRKGTRTSGSLFPETMALAIDTWFRTEDQVVEEISFRTTETEGLPVITNSDGAVISYRISSLTPSANDIIGSIMTGINFEDGIETARGSWVTRETDVALEENYFSCFPFMFYTEDTEDNGIIFEKGIYVPEGIKGADTFMSLKWPKKTDIFPLQTVSGFDYSFMGVAHCTVLESPPLFTLTAGETYIVEWNGAEYNCKAYEVTFNGFQAIYIGNGSALGYESNGEPFCITYNITLNGTQFITTETDSEFTIRIYQYPSTNIELTSLSVTENGTYIAPEGTAYSQVDVEVEGGGATVETDIFPLQTVEGFEDYTDYYPFAKGLVSLSPSPFIPVVGETYFIEWDGTTYECEAKATDPGIAGYSIYLGAIDEDPQFEMPGNGEPFCIMLSPAEVTGDVDHLDIGCTNSTATSHTIRVYQKLTLVKLQSLDITENGTYTAPAGVAYSPITVNVEGGDGEKIVDIFPLQTVEGFEDLDGIMTVQLPVDFLLVAGETYFIEWEGTTYECASIEAYSDESLSQIAMGDLSLMEGPGNGEPFIIAHIHWYDNDTKILMIGALNSTATSHTIRIYRKAIISSVEIQSLNITENGTYTAPDKVAYSPITVNIPATPAEVSTEAEMTALLESGEVGGVYKYTGESTDTYENGALYVLEESE